MPYSSQDSQSCSLASSYPLLHPLLYPLVYPLLSWVVCI
jgi:hypothetical protein